MITGKQQTIKTGMRVATPKKRFSHASMSAPPEKGLLYQPILGSSQLKLLLSQLSPKTELILANAPFLDSASKYQLVRLKALKGILLSDKYFLSKYFKREYLKQTSAQSMVALVQGLQALGRRSSATPENNFWINNLIINCIQISICEN